MAHFQNKMFEIFLSRRHTRLHAFCHVITFLQIVQLINDLKMTGGGALIIFVIYIACMYGFRLLYAMESRIHS